jgi:hypothetical protein
MGSSGGGLDSANFLIFLVIGPLPGGRAGGALRRRINPERSLARHRVQGIDVYMLEMAHWKMESWAWTSER